MTTEIIRAILIFIKGINGRSRNLNVSGTERS